MAYKILRLDDYGRGITKVDDKICFVNNALEDEEVEISIINDKSKFMEADSKELNNISINRQHVKCPYYFTCGGCNIAHMKYDKQLDFKKNKVINILSRYADINYVVNDILPSKEFGYRNKVVLKVENGKLGLFKDSSNTLVEIDKCLLCKDKINKTIEVLKSIDLTNIREIFIRVNFNDEILLVLTGNNIDRMYYMDLDIDNIVIIDNGEESIVKGNNYLIDMIGDIKYKVSYESFFQVNYIGVNKLYEQVKKYALEEENDIILDLYCGTGSIALYLNECAKKIYGVEINSKAVEDANYNKGLNNINNVEFLCSDVGLIKDKYKNVDLVVVDPPRSGLSKSAIRNVLDIASERIIYVSCDPFTLARDLKVLKEEYTIKEVKVVDMFPNTYHCESITILEKKSL